MIRGLTFVGRDETLVMLIERMDLRFGAGWRVDRIAAILLHVVGLGPPKKPWVMMILVLLEAGARLRHALRQSQEEDCFHHCSPRSVVAEHLSGQDHSEKSQQVDQPA